MFTITSIGTNLDKHKVMPDNMLRIPVKEGRRKTAMVYVKDLAEANSMVGKDWCVEWTEIMAGATLNETTGEWEGGVSTGRWEVISTYAEYERKQNKNADNLTQVIVAKKLMGFQKELLLAKLAAAKADVKTEDLFVN